MKSIFFFVLLTFLACQSDAEQRFILPEEIPDFSRRVQALPLSLSAPLVYPAYILDYFHFYGIDFQDIPHYYGYLRSDGIKLMVHVYLPPDADYAVYLCHGYLVHSASYGDLIATLLDAGYAVVSFDMPGHGLSGGQRGHIDSFGNYAAVIKNLTSRLAGSIPPPLGIIGLSTGSAAILEYLRTSESLFNCHILAAPLIRSDKWALSKTGNFLFGWMLKKVRSLNRDTTSDPEARHFLQKIDPLKLREVPLSWVKALYAWNEVLEQEKVLTEERVIVIQGDKDVVVQWKYNLEFLAGKVSNLKIHTIAGGKHELFLDAAAIRRQVYEIILAELDQGK